ncbi:MAG: hypothetical protein U0263_06925 [Polyangiaceae bacterium]
MGFSLKSFVLPAAAVAYVCFGAMSTRGGVWPVVALVGLVLGLALVWRRTEAPRAGEDHTELVARRVVRAVAWGAALWVAARTGSSGRAGLDAVANVGVGTASVAALVALARIASLGGLLTPPPATRSLDAAAFAGFLWAIAVAAPATRAVLPEQMVILDPLAIDYATTSAGLGEPSASGRDEPPAALATPARARSSRPRIRSPRAVAHRILRRRTCSVARRGSARSGAPRRRDRRGTGGHMGCVDSRSHSRRARSPRHPGGGNLGSPTLLVTAFVAKNAPNHAGSVVLGATLLATLIGLIAQRVSANLAPEQSRWLEAIDSASRGAQEPEPDGAIRAALVALSKATAVPGQKPELWRNDPEEVLSVDLAGYLHVERTRARIASTSWRWPNPSAHCDATCSRHWKCGGRRCARSCLGSRAAARSAPRSSSTRTARSVSYCCPKGRVRRS